MQSRRQRWLSPAGAALAPVLLAGALTPFADVDDQTNVAFAFLLLVVGAAAYGRLPAGLTASVASFLTFNFFFIAPTRTLTVSARKDLGVLLGFLAVSVVISSLVARIEAHRDAAERAVRDAEVVLEVSGSLSAPAEAGNDMRAVAELAQTRLGLRAVAVVLVEGHTLTVLHDAGVPPKRQGIAVRCTAKAPDEQGRKAHHPKSRSADSTGIEAAFEKSSTHHW